MKQIIFRDAFQHNLKRLPKNIQNKIGDLLPILAIDPFHPLLHTKYLKDPLRGLFSFRITREWRVLFCCPDSDTVELITVGHRRNVYK